MDTVETVIIGAGQAGLATAYHLQKTGRELRRPRPQPADRGQLAPAVGQPAALLPRQVRRPAGHAVPRSEVVVPRQGRRGRLPRGRTPAASSCRSGSAYGSTGSPRPRTGTASSSPPTSARSTATTWWSRPAPSGGRRTIPELRRRPGPVDPAAALERVPPTRTAPRRPGPRGRRLALGHATSPTRWPRPVRPRWPDATAARSRSGSSRGGCTSSSRSCCSRGATW